MKVVDLIKDFPVESRDIATIFPYADNAKLHSDSQVEDIATSIRTFGFDQPIVVDKDGVVIKGHGRRLAALRLGLKKVPIVVRGDLTPEQVKAARLADNRVAEGEVDTVLLQKELQALAEADFDLTSMGFDERELDFLVSDVTELNDDAFVADLETAVAEVEAQTQAKLDEMRTEEVAIGKALGIKSVPRSAERAINAFMLKLRADYALPPEQAFVRFVEELISEVTE